MEQRLKEKLVRKQFLRLNSLRPVCLISVGSTQDYIVNELKSESEGDFVMSEIQTGGKGREGRKWISPRGGLWLSITLKPERPELADKLSGLAAKSVMETLRDDYSLSGCLIKVPNDVICNGKKIAGVLVDAVLKGNVMVVYLGIGANVNNRISQESEIARVATSYVEEKHKEIPLEDFTVSLLSRLDRIYDNLLKA